MANNKLSIVTYLTICLIEECAEIIQRACKALRFGWYEVQPGQGLTNTTRLRQEFGDLLGVVELLQARGVDLDVIRATIMGKKTKVREFMQLSQELGILEPSEDL